MEDEMKKNLLIVTMLVMMTSLVFAGMTGETEFNYGVKLGFFGPSNDVMQDMYGGGLLIGAEFIVWTTEDFGASFGIERYGASGTPYGAETASSAETKISIIPLTFNGLYRMNIVDTGFVPYLGLGAGYYLINEEMSVSWGGSTQTVEARADTFGFNYLPVYK